MINQTSLKLNYKKNIAGKLSIALNTGERAVTLVSYNITWKLDVKRAERIVIIFSKKDACKTE